MKTKNSNLMSPMEALVNACRTQEATISKLLNVIEAKGTQAYNYVKDKTAKFSKSKETSDKKTSNEHFIETLRTIGRPSTTWEISNKLRNVNPHFKKLSKNKKAFMQLVYSCASLLTKDGSIERIPVGDGSYEYTLKEFKKSPSANVPKEEDKKTNHQYFLEVLTEIGHPATTSEIATRLRKTNPHFKKLSRDKKGFMQLVYSSASTLSKEGKIDRKPISGKSFEYGLPNWKKQAA